MSVISPLDQQATSLSAGSVPHSVARAAWVWSQDDPDQTNVWVYARRRFNVRDTTTGYLNISADLRYMAWVNGHGVGFGPPKAHIARPALDRVPIHEYLHAGRNVLTVLVYSLGNVDDISSVMPRRGGLLASIEVDGDFVVTDRQWKACRERAYQAFALRRGEMQPHNEVFDDCMSLGEPWRPDYDDSGWPSATELSDGPLIEPYTAIESRDIPLIPWLSYPPQRIIETGRATFSGPVRFDSITDVAHQIARAERLPDNDRHIDIDHRRHAVSLDARDVSDHESLYVRWDWGCIWTGYPVVTISGDPGTVIDLSYGEHLPQNQIDPTKHGMQYFDRIILSDRVCCHRIMWPKCFRYMQADVRGGKAIFHDVTLERSTYPIEHRGGFHSSDAVLDQAWRIGAHTLQLCMEDSYMDTPWRERGSWLGDTIVNVKANYYAFGDTALANRLLRLHVFGQLPDGSMCCKYPGRCSSHIHTWSLTFPMLLLDYFSYTGDASFVRDLWPTCHRIVDWLEDHRGDDGLYAGFPLKVTPHDNIYMFIDWAPVDTSGANAAFHAYAYRFLKACEQLAGIVGDASREAFCRRRGADVQQAFRDRFWDSSRGIFVNGWKNGERTRRWGCQENYLSMAMDLATVEQRRSIIRRLTDEQLTATFVPRSGDYDEDLATVAIALNTYRWDDDNMVPLGTPYFGYWAVVALFEAGMGAEALDLIRQHWGNYSKQGATTTWENWDTQASLSHAWGVGPVVALGRYVLGVAWSEHDPDRYEVLPQRIDLVWAKGRVPLRKGVTDVKWCWQDGWELCVLVPEGCRATIGLPRNDARDLVLNGETVRDPVTMRRGEVEFIAAEVSAGMHHLTHSPPGAGAGGNGGVTQP